MRSHVGTNDGYWLIIIWRMEQPVSTEKQLLTGQCTCISSKEGSDALMPA